MNETRVEHIINGDSWCHTRANIS